MPDPKKLKKKPAKNEKDRKKRLKSLSFLLIVALLFLYAFKISGQFQTPAINLPYSKFSKIVDSDKIRISKAWVIKTDEGVEFKAKIAKGTFATDPSASSALEEILGGRVERDKDFFFTTYLPQITQSMINHWEERDIPFEFRPEKMNWMSMVLSLLPWILMILFWVFIFRQMQSGGGAGGGRGLFSFGKSRARLLPLDMPKTTFEDVAGADEAKQELEEIIEFLKEPKKFEVLGGKIPKGVLLLGAPGTGKTLLARAVAGEAGVPFFSMSGSDFVEMFVGVGASRVRDLFEQGKKSAPCIIFIDEIDAVGRHRGAGLGGGHDEREQTLNQLLVEMDGFETNTGVILIAATNRPDVLDPALLRPGRFDRQVVVDRPDIKGRLGILKVHTRKVPLSPDSDLSILARATPGCSGADLANMINEAALLAARYGQKEVTMVDLEEAKDKVLMGAERRSMVINEKEKKVIAYHEAGHALAGKMLKNADPVHKITIIPRGLALGTTFHLPEQDKHINTRAYYLDEISALFGGRVAEEIIFGDISTGASNDIERATDLARRMVCDWGMSERLGPIAYGKKEEQIFLGREIAQHRDFSEQTAEAIDEEVKRIINERLKVTREILTGNRHKLEALAEAVLEHEYLDAEEINKVMGGEKLDIIKKPRALPERRKKPSPAKPEGGPPEGDAAASGEDAGKGKFIDQKA